MATIFQVLAARLMQAIVPSLETTKDSDAAEELVSRLFKALGTALMTCRNDPTLMYSGVYVNVSVNVNIRFVQHIIAKPLMRCVR